MKRYYHEISIHPVVNGFVASIGCKTFVFTEDNKEDMVQGLADYLANPDAAEKKWVYNNTPSDGPQPYDPDCCVQEAAQTLSTGRSNNR